MRVDIEKYLVIGPMKQREVFFARVQEKGIIEFITSKTSPVAYTPEIDAIQEALHILRRRVPVKQMVPRDVREAIVVAQDINEKNEALERALEERRILEKEISRIEVFGDFSLQDLHQIERQAHRKVQFFFTKKSSEIEAPQREEVFFIGNRHGLDYYIAINKEKRNYDGMIEMQIDQSLSHLKSSFAELNRQIDTYEAELSYLAHQKQLLQQGLLDALNRFHLEESKGRIETHLDSSLFTTTGWIPKNKVEILKELCQELDLYCEQIAIEESERVPTYLENKGAARLGEDLVNIYDTPSKNDKDPSLWVFCAFGLFFSMIIGDAGYGAILLGLSLFLMYKFGKTSKLLKRVLTLSIFLGIGCVIWGVVTASYFGISIPLDSKLRSFSFIDWMVEKKAAYVIEKQPSIYEELVKQHPQLASIKDPQAFERALTKGEGKKITYDIHDEFADNVLLELVIFIGACHITLSFLRHLKENWAGIGWIIFIVGAYLFAPSVLKAVSLIHYVFGVPFESGAKIGLYLIYAGVGLATVLALIQKKMAGLAEPMLVIQVFADVMSYLRIYALGLAGVMMSSTFNDIASIAPLIFGILIIFAGHTVNFILALMGGLIHGLRLNFIEWYHYSFEGGGKLLNPLTLLKRD
jgi:V/A-type H+-transporting ATPase subunit I